MGGFQALGWGAFLFCELPGGPIAYPEHCHSKLASGRKWLRRRSQDPLHTHTHSEFPWTSHSAGGFCSLRSNLREETAPPGTGCTGPGTTWNWVYFVFVIGVAGMEGRTTYTRGMCPALAFTNPGVRQTSDGNKGLDAASLPPSASLPGHYQT